MTPKTSQEIRTMRTGGKILAEGLALMQEKCHPGVTTADLDAYVREFFDKKQVRPAFLGYYGFPGAVCTSVNSAVIHGIPSQDTVIQEGDIVSLDCGLILDGLCLDSARTFGVGEITEEHRLLIERTKKSFFKGVSAIKHGATTGDFGAKTEQYLSQFPYGIVRDFAGHGIGQTVHEEPNIPNYGRAGTGTRLVEGMTIACEPMVTLGSEDVYVDPEDDWTVYTEDHSIAAHYEHTLVVTKKGIEVLTEL